MKKQITNKKEKQLTDKVKNKRAPKPNGKLLAPVAKAIKKKQNKGLDKMRMPLPFQGTGISPIENLGYA